MSPLTEYLAIAAAGAAAAGVAAWGSVAPSSQLWGATIRRAPGAGSLALTFDDGPNPSLTPRLLELLERHGARATFFLIGRFVREDQPLALEIARRGHSVGNHTHTHPSLVFLPPQKISEELRRCDEAIETATGAAPQWMRPPYGFRSPFLGGLVRKNGGKGIVMWSRMARDWAPQPPEAVIHRLRRARGGDIVLLHDGDHRVLRGDREHTLQALEYWLPRWKDAGLRFVTLAEFGQDEVSSEPPIQARRTI
ncbi:MAG TPA: polysaccharide deacetylase family protein [Verrucomicrobiae bacterium]|nr:polysaccharide deacetylase family protein [Verrucomicrobiae bacterium]